MGSYLFGGSGKVNDPQPPATALRIQSSLEGVPIPKLWGCNRIAGNLVWYGDFASFQVASDPTGGGGKGLGGNPNQGTTTNYTAAVAIALCSGPISFVDQVWENQSVQAPADLNMTILVGGYDQAPWGYLTSLHPDQADAYRGIALSVGQLQLGSSADLPNYSFIVTSPISFAIPGGVVRDANARDVVVDFLTNPYDGVGFPSASLGSLDSYSNYTLALSLVISPVLVNQTQASSFLNDIAEATNAAFRWSSGVLDLIPYGDQQVSGNGVVYVPNVQPEYDIAEDDLLPNQGSAGQAGTGNAPIIVVREDRTQMDNWIKVTFLDRNSNYNPVTVDAKDEAAIDTYGTRSSNPKRYDFFTYSPAAQMSANLLIGRAQIARSFTFTLGERFILLDPMDVITLTNPRQGLRRQPVRLEEIQENDDGSLTYTAEEFNGTALAPVYGGEARLGYVPNRQVDPGNINPPLIFEPTDELGGGLAIWVAASGANLGLWGGANVYASEDGTTYQFKGTVTGASRMGVLSADFSSFTPNPTGGQTIDTTSVLSVDLTQSAGQLISGTQQDALSLNTACYVDGEIVAYQVAALTATNKYGLSYLVRGAFGTEDNIGLHKAGSPFARLDNGIVKVPFDQSQIGKTIYLKFQSFNVWGGGLQDLSEVAPVAYTITGVALTSPLPAVTNVRATYVDGVLTLACDPIEDFRPAIFYEVRYGDTPDSAVTLGRVGSPKFPLSRDGRFWVAGWVQPVAGLVVYSESWVSLDVEGTLLVKNVIASIDEKATGWLGLFSGGAGISGGNIATGGGGNVLVETSFLGISDLFALGGNVSGFYEAPSAHWVNVGRVAACPVKMSWIGTGVPVGNDFLGVTELLSLADVLGARSTQFIDVYPVIAVALSANQDLYAVDPTDLYAYDDLYTAGLPFGPYQKYEPGAYLGQWFKWGMVLNTVDPNTQAVCAAFAVEVDVPDRVDTTGTISSVVTSLTNLTIPSGGITIVFTPDGATSPAPFNGGADGTVSGLPHIQVTCGQGAVGDVLVISGLSLSQVTIQWTNGGVGVTRNGNNIFIQGF